MPIKLITTADSGVLVLNSNFEPSSMRSATLNKANTVFTNYFLVPTSLVDVSKMSGVTKVRGILNFTMTRTEGSIYPHIYSICGNKDNIITIHENTGVSSSSKTAYIDTVEPNVNGDKLPMYIDGRALFTYGDKDYYAYKMEMSCGGILVKFTGSFTTNYYAFEVTYSGSQIYNGLNNIASAYLGIQPIPSIYLGSNKLL